MRKLILAVLAVALVITVAAGTFVTSRIRTVSADLAQRLESQTGVQLASSGLPGVSFWPRFSISFGNVVIPAPKGVSSAPLAVIDTLRVVPADGLLGLADECASLVVHGLDKPTRWVVCPARGVRRSHSSGPAACRRGRPRPRGRA